MSAKIRHIAIVSDQYALEGRFYQAVFGMRMGEDARPERAVTVSDGYVGLNINPRKPGRPAGLDHFGLEVDDARAAIERLERYPGVHALKRPSSRPFAGVTAHDPAGNVFDISEPSMENRKSVYVESERRQDRMVSHLAIRTLQVEEVANFYVDVFGLERRSDYRLTDGAVSLILIPWDIRDYEGGGIVRPGPDHIGFKVESVAAVKEQLARVGDDNPHLRPIPMSGREGEARLKLFAKCPCGTYRFSDPDGVLVDIAD